MAWNQREEKELYLQDLLYKSSRIKYTELSCNLTLVWFTPSFLKHAINPLKHNVQLTHPPYLSVKFYNKTPTCLSRASQNAHPNLLKLPNIMVESLFSLFSWRQSSILNMWRSSVKLWVSGILQINKKVVPLMLVVCKDERSVVKVGIVLQL